jgi:excisionase family DNA binding protein
MRTAKPSAAKHPHTIPPEDRLMTVTELADLIGCSERTVYRQADIGNLPAPLKIGRLIRWQARCITSWIEAGCPKQGTRAAVGSTQRNRK